MDGRMDLSVRPARVAERDQLVDLWERSARATHAFLSEADIVSLRPQVARELASNAIDWWVAVTADDTPIGFLGFASNAIEGLFIDPDRLGQGAGKRLVAHAQQLSRDALSVEVNEQNQAAVAFYNALGFAVVARSPLDDAGRPFPTLRMMRARPG
jgi:putative acetyltransferase